MNSGLSSGFIVSDAEFPHVPPSNSWVSETLARKTATLKAIYQSFLNVDPTIDSEDEMWNGLLTGGSHNGEAARWARMHYLYGGRSAMRTIADALVAADAPTPLRIMDFPCGHGRVTRFMRSAFPDAVIYGGDVNMKGVAFCSEQFSALPIPSQTDLMQVELPASLDLIWCGSLATHLPEDSCLVLFSRLIDALAPGGVAGITVCGRGMAWAQKNMFKTIADEPFKRIEGKLEAEGFGYEDYPGSDGYGMTFVDFRWIKKVIESRTDAYLLSYAEKAWHGGQDVAWFVKRPMEHWYDWAND